MILSIWRSNDIISYMCRDNNSRKTNKIQHLNNLSHIAAIIILRTHHHLYQNMHKQNIIWLITIKIYQSRKIYQYIWISDQCWQLTVGHFTKYRSLQRRIFTCYCCVLVTVPKFCVSLIIYLWHNMITTSMWTRIIPKLLYLHVSLHTNVAEGSWTIYFRFKALFFDEGKNVIAKNTKIAGNGQVYFKRRLSEMAKCL